MAGEVKFGWQLAPFITRLFNVSLATGCFPAKFKHAIVLPLLKRNDLDKDQLKAVASPGFGVRGARRSRRRRREHWRAKAPSGVGYGEACPLPSRLEGLGERRELPQRCPGRSPGRYHNFCMF